MCCASKASKPHGEEILACERSQGFRRIFCFTISIAPIMTQTHRFAVLYIRLRMWARQVPLGPTAARLDIVAASIFAMLAAYSGPCAPWRRPWPAELWTLYYVHSTWTFYIEASLERGVARHNWLCEWAFLLFWEGLEKPTNSFVLKNENRDGVLFLFSYQATRVENGTIPMVSTCSRRVVYGQVKDWFLRSSF